MTRTLAILCTTILILTSACEQVNEQPDKAASKESRIQEVYTSVADQPKLKTFKLLHNSTTLNTYETPSQALPEWYSVHTARPALLLYANNPLLQQITTKILTNTLEQLKAENHKAFRYDNPNTVILPTMTLSAALEANLFSAVYWVFPSSVDIETLSVERFRDQMISIGALNSDEARTLTLSEGVFSGIVRGVPFHAMHPQAKLAITNPVVLHFDLGYPAPLYKSEIKTPAFTLIFNILQDLRDREINALTATFSYSQITGDIPLGSRFIGKALETLFNMPEKLDEPLPTAWQQYANAIHLPELILSRDALKVLVKMKKEVSNDPAIDYSLYKISREVKEARQVALDHLASAVALDKIYALEYLTLAPVAIEQNRPDEALRMTRLTYEAMPENPFLKIDYCRALIAAGHNDAAQPLIKELLSLNWSPQTYPWVPDLLDDLHKQVSVGQQE